ncbi:MULTISPECIES: 3-oxoacyl-ACP synthase III [unclassified Wenzhouxiangella]|uniref:3-oxoacyl-ACP synthase III n=1 Tax=unclassified Wenzhouxiangella TaxID=2613841 RepID=UPI000E327F67|nr:MULTISPECIES: 3-oxoacyl-ACP synthase III [unclassified Wenzhouxiangella]RFF28761.1 3-oxoacyl-ACP synthase III [Wenzhouxiangella sp. 15181]RFP67835.1 3-oxoacyl-ACP synthase III [Wenzhouxiangella sp. 15190]
MLFDNVAIKSVVSVDAPHMVTSAEIRDRLEPTFQKLRMRGNPLIDVAGIEERRFWDIGVQPSDAATMAAEKALARADIDRDRVGILINTSVTRDFLEPSTACMVHSNLKLSNTCESFDVGNACLAFINGMNIAAHMLDRGEIDYALIVNAENVREVCEITINRLLEPGVTRKQFKSEFASLTLGCGAAAMVMSRGDLEPDGHQYKGGVSRAATEFNNLCRGWDDLMWTDAKSLLREGMKLAGATYTTARQVLGWVANELDHVVIHQVSRVHTEAFIRAFGVEPEKIFRIFPKLGNVGPASIPTVLSKIIDAGRVNRGDRIALMGIGSGLNCSMAEVVW